MCHTDPGARYLKIVYTSNSTLIVLLLNPIMASYALAVAEGRKEKANRLFPSDIADDSCLLLIGSIST